MISKSIDTSDFDSAWYFKWARLLKQDQKNRGKYMLRSNKFWQNAAIAQAFDDAEVLRSGASVAGFGVGKERLPALFASQEVNVLATDQDFESLKAKRWTNDQLAKDANSLNQIGICKPSVFREKVRFSSLDMTKIPNKLHNQFDGVWSNCALGHLGSIQEGLKFIENSVMCLKPGGVAAHTTEINVLSDKKTVEAGNTVVFRLSDIYGLSKNLINKGFVVKPFWLSAKNFKNPEGKLAMNPQWGTDASYILIDGHIATQAIVIVSRPSKKPTYFMKVYNKLSLYIAYNSSLRRMNKLREVTPFVEIINAQGVKNSDYKITPLKIAPSVDKNTKQLFIGYRNDSPFCLMDVNCIYGSMPVVLGTNKPVNRRSKNSNKQWHSNNRPSIHMYVRSEKNWQPLSYALPGEEFAYEVPLAKKRIKGAESFILIQETGGPIVGSEVEAKIS